MYIWHFKYKLVNSSKSNRTRRLRFDLSPFCGGKMAEMLKSDSSKIGVFSSTHQGQYNTEGNLLSRENKHIT